MPKASLRERVVTFGRPDWFPCFGIQVSGFRKRFQAKHGRFSTMVLTTLFSSPFSRLNLWPTSVLTYDRPLSLLKTALSHQLAFVLNHAAKIQLFSPRRAVSPKSETAFPWERDVWGERWGLRALISPLAYSRSAFLRWPSTIRALHPAVLIEILNLAQSRCLQEECRNNCQREKVETADFRKN